MKKLKCDDLLGKTGPLGQAARMASTPSSWSIGEAAHASGVKLETIRYYERIDLLPEPPRNRSGYRVYAREHVDRLSFIRRARAIGLSLDRIRELLALSSDARKPCASVDQLIRDHIGAIEQKIDDLTRLHRELSRLADSCGGGDVGRCLIVDSLAKSDLCDGTGDEPDV